jgi:hypothetical protein
LAKRGEMEEKTKKIRRWKKILAVLTDEQRKQYKEMVGEPFRKDFRQMQGGRRETGAVDNAGAKSK